MFTAGIQGDMFFRPTSQPGPRMETTGRSLVLMRHGTEGMQAAVRTLQESADLSLFHTSDLRDGFRISEMPESSAMLLDSIGVAIVNGDPDQIGRLSVLATRSDSGDRVQALRKVPGVSAVEHERSFQLPPSDSDVQ